MLSRQVMTAMSHQNPLHQVELRLCEYCGIAGKVRCRDHKDVLKKIIVFSVQCLTLTSDYSLGELTPRRA